MSLSTYSYVYNHTCLLIMLRNLKFDSHIMVVLAKTLTLELKLKSIKSTMSPRNVESLIRYFNK